MDSNSDEQTELLRNIWNEMKAIDRNLGGRLDKVAAELVQVRTELKAEISGVKTEVAGVKTEVAEIKHELVEIRTDVSEIRTDMHDVRLEIKAVRVATQGTFELHGRDQRELRERVDRIEDHLGLRPPKRKH